MSPMIYTRRKHEAILFTSTFYTLYCLEIDIVCATETNIFTAKKNFS